MSKQLIYTSCKRSINNDHQGMQPWSYSPDIPQNILETMTRMGSYSLSGTPYKPIADEETYKSYPIAFRHICTIDGNHLFSKSVYLGSDWSKTREGTNFLSHVIFDNLFDRYPIEYLDSPSLISSIDHEKISSAERPDYLPPCSIQSSDNSKLDETAIVQFISKNKEDVQHLLKLTILSKKRITISDSLEKIPFWIAAVSYCMPHAFAEKLSFSTFGKMMETEGASIVPEFTKNPGFRIVSPEIDIDADPVLNRYCEALFSDMSIMEDFNRYVNSLKLGSKKIEDLPLYYLMYLYSSDDESYLELSNIDEITGILLKFPKSFGEKALYRNLKTGLETNACEDTLELYTKCRTYNMKPEHRRDLDDLYSKVVYDKLLKSRDPDYIIIKSEDFINAMKLRLDFGDEIVLKNPGEIYIAFQIWKNTHDERARDLLRNSELSSGSTILSLLFKKKPIEIIRDLSEETMLSDSVKSVLIADSVQDFSSMNTDQKMKLTEYIGGNDKVNGPEIIRQLNKNQSDRPILENYINSLNVSNCQFTYHDAIKCCLDLTPCPYDMLVKSVEREGDAEEENARMVIQKFNSQLIPSNIDRKDVDICKKIEDCLDNYGDVLDRGDNRIQATLALDGLVNLRKKMPNHLDYMPGSDDLKKYIIRACEFYFGESNKEDTDYVTGFFDKLTGLFGDENRKSVEEIIFEFTVDKRESIEEYTLLVILSIALKNNYDVGESPVHDLASFLLKKKDKEKNVAKLRSLTDEHVDELINSIADESKWSDRFKFGRSKKNE